MSTKSAGQAVKAGYKNIRVMLAGEPAWVKAGYPTYANYGWVCRGNIVLIDLRSAEKDAAARIPRSVSMPFADFADNYDEIPIKAPVVLYSDKDEETTAAMKILHDNGYKKVSLVEGNFLGWKRVGGSLEKGPVVTDVRWKRILAEGEVSVAEFERALADPKVATILDVRTKAEVASGKFPSSQHIPLDELCKDMDQFVCKIRDLQKDEKIYIHCTTGARAEMAYKELKKRDFNAFYLVAEVDCKGNDCSIEE
ncbi:MAG: rhodanese-like domain-containing protein [Proteobacteria bacterium]|nr:rhodanese-like domain-containing protein [Pseudomonadota bacterium]MBU1233630.1 rhodanese-like domain-containing protein [Pseudomonadota bacterium]MBU1419818.1 rhodanese-like domain-containing protein [Pseudomonadota bacterium]MBU1456786.1 rhodanese-like domain-containing protein [Pseudomonadota bacterium]